MDILITFNHRESDLEKMPLAELTQFVLKSEGKPDNTEVSISFVSDEKIAELNERYRGIQGPTDVLSFECDNIEDEVTVNCADDIYELGDVIIAPDVAERQSAEYGNTLTQEISLLLVHGLLHLCGYDHMEDEEAHVMETREAELLGQWAAIRHEQKIATRLGTL